jgi:hypothetical protein
VSHKRRPVLASRFPVHVTYRLVRRLPSARRPALFRAIRRAFNAGREARRGKVFADRYHMRILNTPTEVKNALRYVLDNRWKHNPRRPDFIVEQDDCSSLALLETAVEAPRTWLLRSAERALQLRRQRA